mgnify:CR=1 FL=1
MAGRTAAPRLRCSGGIWYECSRRKVKKLNLRVRRDGSVAVSIPLRMDWAQADRFVAEQAQWIAEAQARQLARAERQTETPLPPKEVALAYFTAMSDAVYPAFAQVLGGQKPTIKVRSMVSRWGVCAMAKRQITFALQLYNMPPAAQIYVVVHEYCHFLQPNHVLGRGGKAAAGLESPAGITKIRASPAIEGRKYHNNYVKRKSEIQR